MWTCLVASQWPGADGTSHLDEWAPVKDILLWLLDVIPHHFSPKQLIQDIDKVFINAKTKAKVWVQCGSEFGWYEGVIIIIQKALYDLTMPHRYASKHNLQNRVATSMWTLRGHTRPCV